MLPIRCLIVDDEPPAIMLLEKYASMIEQLQVVEQCHSAVKAFDILKNESIDLIFLDIQMPVLNGIDFIKTLRQPPAIILTTAYREYALDGYDLDIIDYLLKPIAFDRFLKAIDRYNNRTTIVKESPTSTSSVATTPYCFFNVGRNHHKVLIDDILYLESLKDYTRIHTTLDHLVVKGNIGSTLKLLPMEQFARIHRSYAIGLSHLQTYNQRAVEIAGQTLPIGVSYRTAFFERLC